MEKHAYPERSELMLPDISRAWGCPQRYIQGPDEFDNVFRYGREYGDHFLFVIDGGIYDMMLERIEAVPDKAGCCWESVRFSGESSLEAAAELAELVRQHNCSLLVGLGGGKVLDTAKLAADAVNLPRLIVPTSASSDAPAADWAAIYTPEGVHLRGQRTRRSTELVLVDSRIIAEAPARLFSAGLGDALATWFEALACERSYTPNCVARGYRRCRAAMAVSRECYEILMADGEAALRAVKSHLVTEAVENVIEANILLSGLGFINGGLAGSHGLHSGFSAVPGGEGALHGEKVAFGLLCQLVMENAPKAEFKQILGFLNAVDLPVTLEQLGIEASEANLDAITEHTVCKNALIHHEPFAISRELVKNAILAANDMGRAFLAGAI